MEQAILRISLGKDKASDDEMCVDTQVSGD